jgi:poly(hydroxyalkanoate) depolymerase family esterase
MFVSSSYSNSSGARAYKLYVPKSQGRKPRPLVVMLHGCGQSPDDFAAGTHMNQLAVRHDFLVVYPGQSASANAMYCWNWFNVKDQVRDDGEPSLIAGIVRKVASEYSIDKQQIFVAGLSAGGAMALILGETYQDLFAAVGVHSGLPYAVAHDASSAIAAMQGSIGSRHQRAHSAHRAPQRPSVRAKSIPTIVFHGDADLTINIKNGADIVDQVVSREAAIHGVLRVTARNGRSAGGRGYTVTVYRGEGLQPIVEYWLLHGAGHAWSGGSATGSFTDPTGPNASAEMVRFFLLAQRKPATTRPG